MPPLAACHGDNCILAEHCQRHEVHQATLEGELISYVLPELIDGECDVFVPSDRAMEELDRQYRTEAPDARSH